MQCLSDGDCSGGAPRCATNNNTCVECVSDNDCSGTDECNNNVCEATRQMCFSDSDCISNTCVLGYCDCENGGNADCSNGEVCKLFFGFPTGFYCDVP